jgi:Cu+-exporting ATPase
LRADPAVVRTSVFRVEGMTCALCAKAIEKTLREIEGVRSVQVDREAEEVAVVAEGDLAFDRIEQAIERAGPYQAELVQ